MVTMGWEGDIKHADEKVLDTACFRIEGFNPPYEHQMFKAVGKNQISKNQSVRKIKMARGGFRAGSGPKKGTKYRPRLSKSKPKDNIPSDKETATAENLDPLTFMLRTMNNPNESKEIRFRAAVSAAPFCHARKGESGIGKKEEAAERAAKAGDGKFQVGRPPHLKVVKKGERLVRAEANLSKILDKPEEVPESQHGKP